VCISLSLNLLLTLSNKLTVEIPEYGGEINQGVIGSPRFINPLLATSQTDLFLSKIIFTPLANIDSEGNLKPIIAKECIEDSGQKIIDCTVLENLVFSDKSPLTTSDILFTFQTKKALALKKDPLSSWGNISVEILSENTLRFKTSSSFEDLKNKLSLGIIPKSLWENIPVDSFEDSYLNIEPVGSGPFKLSHISYKDSLPSEVVLLPNRHFAGKKPFLKKLVFKIYTNQLSLLSALKNNDINSTNSLDNKLIDETIVRDFNIQKINTKNEIALWVNKSQTQTPSAQKLSYIGNLVDRNQIIDSIENGYGIPLFSKDSPRSDLASKITLSSPIPIAVQKDDDLIKTAEILSEILESFGIMTTVQVFDQGLFIDQMQQGKYSFILASSQEPIGGYQHLIPLYTKPFVQIFTKDIKVENPQKVSTSEEIFEQTNLWYARTDKVWKWFIK
ncbi:MAG TPA: ABC transporter substrate-binding protein, partial [Candidatus Paceibacterota bacterium]|nr:ABC transporter substrate-binding protein [Candidatus Paceibacterota bacterium]